MKFFVAIAALLLVQGCLAKPKPETPATKDSFQELSENAQKLAKKVSDDLGLSDLTDADKLKKTLNENTNKILENLNLYIQKIKAETKAHEGEVQDVFKTAETKLAETAEALNKNLSPEVKAKADEMKNNFNKAFQDVADQINQLAKDPKVSAVQNDLKKAGEDFLNEFIEIGKSLDTKVKSVVADHEKTHKN